MAQAGFMSMMHPATPAFDALRLPLRALLKRCAPTVRREGDNAVYLGQGQPVMVFPVLGGGPDSTAALRQTTGAWAWTPARATAT
jgi:hypothetical protein